MCLDLSLWGWALELTDMSSFIQILDRWHASSQMDLVPMKSLQALSNSISAIPHSYTYCYVRVRGLRRTVLQLPFQRLHTKVLWQVGGSPEQTLNAKPLEVNLKLWIVH